MMSAPEQVTLNQNVLPLSMYANQPLLTLPSDLYSMPPWPVLPRLAHQTQLETWPLAAILLRLALGPATLIFFVPTAVSMQGPNLPGFHMVVASRVPLLPPAMS